MGIFDETSTYIITACQDNICRVYLTDSGTCCRVLNGHICPLNSVDMSRDRLHVLTASDDKTAKVWD